MPASNFNFAKNNDFFNSSSSTASERESFWLEQMRRLEQELLVREEQIQNLLSLLETKSTSK
jgi:hypothetical protein